MKSLNNYIWLFIILLNGFMAFSSGNCTNTSSWGTAAAPTTNTSVTISTCNYQTEYSTITNIVAGNTYVLTSDCGGYVTVHSGSNSGTIVAMCN
jgi:hypothetical protein